VISGVAVATTSSVTGLSHFVNMYGGKAKYKNRMPTTEGWNTFFPNPPKIAFPKNTPKVDPMAAIHQVAVGGIINANINGTISHAFSMVFFRTLANTNSTRYAKAKDTAVISNTFNPKIYVA
jgi:hypothetical protein